MPSVFHHHFSVSPTKKVNSSFTELRLTFLFFCHSKGRNPKLWPTQKHTVTDVRSLHFKLTILWLFFLSFFYEEKKLHLHEKTQACWKKVLQDFNFTMSVCIILYALVWCSYLCIMWRRTQVEMTGSTRAKQSICSNWQNLPLELLTIIITIIICWINYVYYYESCFNSAN